MSRGAARRYSSLCVPPRGSSERLRGVRSPCWRGAVGSSRPKSRLSHEKATRAATRRRLHLCVPAHSSSGLGRRPLTAVARVRIPYAPFYAALLLGNRMVTRDRRARDAGNARAVPIPVPTSEIVWRGNAVKPLEIGLERVALDPVHVEREDDRPEPFVTSPCSFPLAAPVLLALPIRHPDPTPPGPERSRQGSLRAG